MSGEQHEEPDKTPPNRETRAEERRESGLTANQEARIIKKALREKWWGEQRWPTDITTEEIQEKEKERPLTIREKVLLAVSTDLSDKDRRVKRIAVKNVIAMESQNQADDHKKDPDGAGEGAVPLVRVVVNNRAEADNLQSITMQQLGKFIDDEDQIEEEIEDAD